MAEKRDDLADVKAGVTDFDRAGRRQHCYEDPNDEGSAPHLCHDLLPIIANNVVPPSIIGNVSWIGDLKLKIRRGETPFYRFMRSVVRGFLRSNLPQPGFLKPIFRTVYELHYAMIVIGRRFTVYFYKEPLFRARCTSAGKNLHIYGEMPYVEGHAEIHLGDDITITGRLTIISGRFLEHPVLRVKDRVSLGNNCVLSVNQEIVIEEDVMISNDCRIFDSDGHPRDAVLRAQHAPLGPRDIRPVLVRRYAWIGNGVQILKGVTIGEGAIVGANSVVISNLPDYCVAIGNPAEVFFQNVGKPKRVAEPV